MRRKQSWKRRVAAAVLAVCMLLAAGLLQAFAAGTASIDMNVTYRQTEARKVLGEVNAFRKGSEAWYWNADNKTKTVCKGLKDYKYDYDLEQIAMQRAVETAAWIVLGCKEGDTPHTRPNGQDWYTVKLPNGVQSYGECLAAGEGLLPTAKDAVSVWKEADQKYEGQSHRRGMLENSDLRVAIGVACVYYGGWYVWAMEFGESTNPTAAAAVNGSATRSVEVTSKYANRDNPPTADTAPADPGKYTIARGSRDGIWHAYKNGVVQKNYTGVLKNAKGAWYYVRNGAVAWDYTGFGKNLQTGIWWRVVSGRVDFKANSIYKNPDNGVWYKTTNGKVTFKETGVFKNDRGWWRVVNSRVDFKANGIFKNANGSWYVKNGCVDFSKNGKVKFNGKTYTVKNGKVQ